MSPIVYLGMLAWAFTYGAGEYFSKIWSEKPSLLLAIITVSCYAISVLAWLPALRAHGTLAVLSTIFALIGLLAGVVIGIFIFHEPVTLKQYIGISLAIVATILLC